MVSLVGAWHTVLAQPMHGSTQCTANTKPPQASTPPTTTHMEPIEAALAAIEAIQPRDRVNYTRVADQHDVARSTLSRRHRGATQSRAANAQSQQKLSNAQELELVQYIKKLTRRGLPPTREMVQNFAANIAQTDVSKSWVTRFINRHSIHLKVDNRHGR